MSVKSSVKKFGVNETQWKVLVLMAANPAITGSQLSEATGVTKRQIEKVISQLKDLGLITRVGSDRKGQWLIVQEVSDA
jgi:ATP-dependent DNA helicase RecG